MTHSSSKESNSSHHPTTTDGRGHTSLQTVVAYSASTTPDTAPTNRQCRDDQRSQQQQRRGPAAPELEDPTRLLAQLFQLSLNLVKSVFQDFTRLGPISRFRPQREL